MDKSKFYQSIIDKLLGAKSILLTTHERPDGDAISSMVAMYDYLTSLGKTCQLFCAGAPDKQSDFLPHVELIITEMEKIDLAKVDLVCALDCSGLQRSRIDGFITAKKLFIINIDHHVSNEQFGGINLVDGEAVSTTEVLHDMFSALNITISKTMATAILTGILTDSGNFAYSLTSPHTFDIASNMLRLGANVRNIMGATSQHKNLETLQLWGLALNRLRYDDENEVAYTILTQSDIKKFGVDITEVDGLAGFLNTLKDAKVILVLYELADGRIKGSFRTNRDDVDVSKLAQAFGGGGHKKAAGFEIQGKFERAGDGWRIN